MTWQAWLTLAVVLVVLVVLVRDLLAPAAAMFGAMVTVLVAGVVTPAQAFSGFSNPAPITVAALYILSKAVEKTGALTPVVSSTLDAGGGRRRSLARLTGPVVGASAFLNNTPIVAMLAPQVNTWAERNDESPSHYLMPLSFAAILGGTVTVIGTSTNLVVSGLLSSAGMEELGFFEITKVGLPAALLGTLVMIALAPLVLPDRRSARRDVREGAREFSVDMVVAADGPLDGKEVEEAGLRHLAGVFLAEIERGGEVIAPVSPRTTLHGADRLRFVGKADDVLDLQNMRGMVSAEQNLVGEMDTTRSTYFEAVVGAASPLVGRTLKEAGFRGRYQAVVMAIHRSGQRVDAKLGAVPIRVGDTLLLVADPNFRNRWGDRRDFLLVAPLGGSPPVTTRRAIWVGVIAVGIVLAAAFHVVPIVEASLIGAIVLVVTGVLTAGEARDAVDLDVIVLIASAFGVAAAIQESGLADSIASGLVSAFDGLGPVGILAGVVIGTVVLTELVTNNAAALLMFPIALSSAAAADLDPRGFAVAIAVAASASFLTPIGYQTNTMVYGPGGYRYTDYARLGVFLTATVFAVTLVTVPIFWPLGR